MAIILTNTTLYSICSYVLEWWLSSVLVCLLLFHVWLSTKAILRLLVVDTIPLIRHCTLQNSYSIHINFLGIALYLWVYGQHESICVWRTEVILKTHYKKFTMVGSKLVSLLLASDRLFLCWPLHFSCHLASD